MNTPKKNILLCLAAAIQLAACNNYGLDDKIRAATSGGNSATGGLTFTNVQGGTYANGALNYTLSNAVKLTATVSLNGSAGGMTIDTGSLPSYIAATISGGGALQISTLSNSANLPTNLTSNQLSPTLRFALSSGTNVSVPLNLSLKRAFVASGSADNTTFTGTVGAFVGSNNCSGATAGIARANCICTYAATQAGLKNAAKYRAFISQGPANSLVLSVAKCNITNKTISSTAFIQMTNFGSGYSSAPTASISGGGCTVGSYTAIFSNGQVPSITVNTNPTACVPNGATAFNISTSGGGGSGATGLFEFSGCQVVPSDGGPWYRTDSQILARDMSFGSGGLLSGAILNPLTLTEAAAVTAADYWTGSQVTGYSTGDDNTGWIGGAPTATYGVSGSTTTTWTNQGTPLTGTTMGKSLACFETD